MANKDPITLINQAIDMVGDDLDGHPLNIERPGKEDFVLVSASTYSSLMQRIYDLEQKSMTEDERQDEQESLLKMLKEAE
jgi:PHD/YefM family antitoxin component YafN of YafNO toxin-antitoxin module